MIFTISLNQVVKVLDNTVEQLLINLAHSLTGAAVMFLAAG